MNLEPLSGPPPKVTTFDHLDTEAFARDLRALRAREEALMGAQDLAHLRKLELWGRLCTWLGYATAWLLPNPISALLISTGAFSRWTIMMHHVGHRGYDRVPGVPARYTSKVFAQGPRRFVDFMDWMVPAGWDLEHNIMHHYHTGDMGDPDLVERDVAWLRRARWPLALKYASLLYFAFTWKVLYYVPRTMRAIQYARARRAGQIGPSLEETGGVATCAYPYDTRALAQRRGTFSPFNARGRETWRRSLLPYALLRFVVLPSLFLPLGTTAALYVLINSLLAEAFTNLHTFVVIGPNHAGEDVHRFEGPMKGRAEFYLRSILGSANYNTGSEVGDFLQGYLNYQIEHHLFPDMPALRLKRLQPQVKSLCQQYGVPYVQEPVFRRVHQLLKVMTGQVSMTLGKTGVGAQQQGPAAQPPQAQDVAVPA